MSALALGALAFAAPTVQAASASSCREAVDNTRYHLELADSPTSATDWQSVRDDAQRYLDEHPWQSPGNQALQQDIDDLNRLCAA
ncbi:hypothetical protein [Streptomyces sp. NPDC094032]|uniref:hypothetical protein n=1 Tax=Streptomyces sp. NPDC094032 TaxID=3155308 RepID=UPI0033341344